MADFLQKRLIAKLKMAHELVGQFAGGYSDGFSSAEEFSAALAKAIHELESGNEGVLGDIQLWFLPTSDWDDFAGQEGIQLGEEVSRIIDQYMMGRTALK
jgi:hypothetical protein